MILALLGLGLDHVAEPIDEDLALLDLVPQREERQDRAIRQEHERVEGNELAGRKLAVDDEQPTREQEKDEREDRHELHRPLVRHDEELGSEQAIGETGEAVTHLRSERVLRGERFDRLDATDGVDLLRAIPAVRILERVVHRTQAARRVPHQQQVERNDGQVDERQLPAVVEHQAQRSHDLGHHRDPLDARVDEHLAKLAHAGQSPLYVSGPPLREVAHRQREQASGQEVERRRVYPNRRRREQVPLSDGEADHRCEDREHGHQPDHEQRLVFVRDRVVDDDLREDRHGELQSRCRECEQTWRRSAHDGAGE